MSNQDFKRLLQNVPFHKTFLPLHEIQTQIKKTAKNSSLQEIMIGRTIENKPLTMFEMGKGEKTALIIGVPHSDEPLGSLVTTHLMRWMAANPEADFFNWRWLIIPVLEQRGMQKNEGWFANLNSFEDMAKYNFREPTEDQCEWSFPFTYKNYEWIHSRPETQAVKDVLKKEKPDMLCSLHHSGFYETYYYFSRDLPEAYPKLNALALDLALPLSHAAPDVPFGKLLSPGFYQTYGLKDYFDYYSCKQPQVLSSMRRGACSDEWYQENVGGFSFNCEVPLFDSNIKKDGKKSHVRLRTLLQGRKSKERETVQYCLEYLAKLEPHFNVADPVLLNSLMKHLSTAILAMEHDEIQEQHAHDLYATNFEIFDKDVMVEISNMLLLGQVWRIAETIRQTIKETWLCDLNVSLERKITLMAEKNKIRGRFKALPLQKLIQMQLGSILIIADILAKNQRT
jgi:hypothetical protein